MEVRILNSLAAFFVGAVLASSSPALAAVGGGAAGAGSGGSGGGGNAGGASGASGGAFSSMGVGPSGPVGNANFVGLNPNGTVMGVGPSGPTGNANYGNFNGITTTNGTVGVILEQSGRVRDLTTLNGNSGFGFSTQGYGFGLGGWGNAFQNINNDDEYMKRERERLRARLNTPSVVPFSSRVVRRGTSVVAIKDQLVDGKLVQSEGTIIQEYGTAPSTSRVASRQHVRTFARVMPHSKKCK